MSEIIIDCQSVNSEKDFWQLYVSTVVPDGAENFGCNLDAFWDAISGGGPGWPGENISKLIFINSESLKNIHTGDFYTSLLNIALKINQIKYSTIKIEFISNTSFIRTNNNTNQ